MLIALIIMLLFAAKLAEEPQRVLLVCFALLVSLAAWLIASDAKDKANGTPN